MHAHRIEASDHVHRRGEPHGLVGGQCLHAGASDGSGWQCRQFVRLPARAATIAASRRA